jgi:hypothetical protein
MTARPAAPGFKEAMDLTTATIDRRAARFRNLVVLLVILVAVSLLGAVLRLSWLPLLGLLALLPLCGFFIFLDTGLVNRWRQQVLEMWAEERLNLDGFTQAISSLRALPPQTVQGMLGSLPTKERTPAAAKPSPALRRALAATVNTIHRCENDWTGLVSIAYTLGVASLALAAVVESWRPLAGALLVAPVLAAAWGFKAARWRRWRRTVLALHRRHGLEWTTFLPAANQLDWGSVPDRKKQRLLDSLHERTGPAGRPLDLRGNHDA